MAQPGQSVLWQILDSIERRMGNASEIMLPALRRALHSFTKRADIIIRQLSYLNSHSGNDLLAVCKQLGQLPPEQYAERLEAAARQLAPMKIQLLDPAQIRLQERRRRRPVETAIEEAQALDPEAQRDIFIQQLLDQAFALDNKSLRTYVFNALREGQRVSTRHLPVTSAPDLLAMAHAIEVAAASNLGQAPQFR